MRTLQVGIFALGVLAFLASLAFVGQPMGDTLWRTGIGAMLTDLVFASLWPPPKSS
jgi:hypothetical protein